MGPRGRRRVAADVKRPRDERPTFVRFVCFSTVDGARNRLGLFQAIDIAVTSDQAVDWAGLEINIVSHWFDHHLDAPDRFERGSWRGPGQAGLSWFKQGAAEHIQTMHRLKTALEHCGVHVEMLTTRDPGTILFEDEFQVVAEPGGRRF